MVYRAIGVMSGSSLDGLDIAFVEFQEQAGKWSYRIREAACYPYGEEWTSKLREAVSMTAADYQQLHADYGHYIGRKLSDFINVHQLQYQVALIASHGHTSFHVPAKRMTAQLGDGAAIAAETGLPVVTDLRSVDIALGGQGAPIVPIGEKLLFPGYEFFLNIGGIANVSANSPPYIAFDICPANRVLNMLAGQAGKAFDEEGTMARSGRVNTELLGTLNALEYYQRPHPKSLANDFGTDIVYPIIKDSGVSLNDALRTYTEHIAFQTSQAFRFLTGPSRVEKQSAKMMITGGGAFNTFLVERIGELLKEQHMEPEVPDARLVNFKEALIMAFIGVLRWRQEFNVLSSVTGASRDSIGGALWIGEEG